MNHVEPRRPGSRAPSTPQRRGDVEALIALVSLDQGIARTEATVASSLALVERTRADIASCELETAATQEALQRMERLGAEAPEIEKGRRLLQDAQAFVCCPHCERVLFNPDWIERR